MSRSGRDRRERQHTGRGETVPGQNSEHASSGGFGIDLSETLEHIRVELGNSPDLKIRQIEIAGEPPVRAAAVHFSELANSESVNDYVMGSLLGITPEERVEHGDGDDGLPAFILQRALEMGQATKIEDWNEMLLALLSGETAILLNGYPCAITCETTGGEWRSVGEPSSQLVVKGPKDSFVESVATNVSLIRRRLKTLRLRLEYMKLGEITHTYIALMYIQDMADDDLLSEVRQRLKAIHIDAVLESGYIEELIQDKTFTPFPTVYNTERPDSAVANLLEGRVVLIIDGTPFVLVLPAVFTQFFQSADDYAQRFDISLLIRIIRYVSFIILILGPSIYIALTTYHYEMIPTTLLISLLAQRENVPFPAFVEALLMETAFEVLREAGVRMPRVVGQTVSVVGALVLGQAVVEAGIITPVMVIVVALTGIASFAIPAYNMSIAGRLIRFVFLFLAGLFGFYGITLGLIVLVAHMNSLRSFGIPYLTPVVPPSLNSRKDTIIRLPLWAKGVSKPRNEEMTPVPQGKRVTSGMTTILLQSSRIRTITGHGQRTGRSSMNKFIRLCRRVTVTVLLCIVLLTLSGCWDSVELNRRAVVSGIAIDRGPSEAEKYVLSFQVVVSEEISGKNSRGTSPVAVYTGSGRSMFEALAKASRQTARFLSLGHVRVIVISEAFGREGIRNIMDILERESETRLTSLMFISKGQTAKDSMTTMTVFSKIPANDLVEKLQTTSKQFGYNYHMEVDDVVRGIQVPGGGPLINGVLVSGEESKSDSNDNLKNIAPSAILKVTGLAAFKGDKMLGWLEENEAVGAALLKNKISQMPLLIKNGGGSYMSFNVYLSQVKVEARADNPEDPLIVIHITQQAGMKEAPNDLDLTDPLELVRLSGLVEKEIRSQLQATVAAARRFKSDFLGFGEAVERDNPQGWKTMKGRWDQIFASCRVEYDIKAIIRHTDMRTSSFQTD